MSEQPNSILGTADYREGDRFDDSTHLALHTHTVPKYDSDYIAETRRLDEARQAHLAAVKAEQEAALSGPEYAEADLTRLAAVRIAAMEGKLVLPQRSSGVVSLLSRTSPRSFKDAA